MRWLIAYATAGVSFAILDSIWLNWAGPNLYAPVIGELMAAQVNMGAALAFYLLYLAGMVWFAIRPGLESSQIKHAMINGALLGALCYATFDLTSQAVFKAWAWHITLLDIAWGAFATSLASTIACAVTLMVIKSRNKQGQN